MRSIFPSRRLTLNFEGDSIRLLSARGGQIEHWRQLSFAPQVMSAGIVHDVDRAAEQLRAAIEETNIGRGKLISAVSGQRSLYRTLTLPEMKGEYLDGAVRRKIRQEIALQPQETDISWQVVGRSNGEVSVYVVALPRDIVDRHVQTIRLAGLEPKSMDVKPLALLHTVGTSEAVIANLEAHGITLVIVRKGLPGLVRTVPLPDNSQNLGGRLDLLAQELQRTIKFYNQSNKADPLPVDTTIYTTGGDFDQGQVMDQLTAMVSYPIELARPPLSLPDNLPVGAYAVNIGLVLKRT